MYKRKWKVKYKIWSHNTSGKKWQNVKPFFKIRLSQNDIKIKEDKANSLPGIKKVNDNSKFKAISNCLFSERNTEKKILPSKY